MSKLIAIAATVFALAGAADAHADRFELSASTGTRWSTAESVDALSADDGHSHSGLAAAMRLDGLRPFGFDLHVETNYDAGTIAGTTFGRIQSELSMHTFQVGARLSTDVAKRTSVFARAAIGYTTGTLSLSDSFGTNARTTGDRAHAGTTTLGGGASVLLAKSERVEFGLRGHLDYAKTTGLSFDAAPDDEGNSLAIPTMSASLGDVDVSGWSLRLGLYARF